MGHRLHGTYGAREGSYARSYRFNPSGERVLSIELGTALDPYLYVLNADGTVFDENDDLTRGILNSRVLNIFPAGTYTIVALPYGAGFTSNFTLN